MFQEEYKKALDGVNPRKITVEDLYNRIAFQREWRVRHFVKLIAVPVLSVCLLFMLAMPVLAEQIPAVCEPVHRVVELWHDQSGSIMP